MATATRTISRAPRKEKVIKEKRMLPPTNQRRITIYSATLEHPPGINATYKTTRNTSRIYKSAPAKNWTEDSLDTMEKMGWKSQPEGLYRMQILYAIYTIAMDVDGPEKLLIDTISQGLNVNDRWLGQPFGVKFFASSRKAQHLDVIVRLDPIESKSEFNDRSQDVWQHQVGQIHKTKEE